MPADRGAFTDADGNAILRPCAFLFIDILGVREMTTGPEAGARLADLSTALRRPLGDFFAPDSPWPATFFSDTLVIVDPTSENLGPHFVLVGRAIQASWMQVNLAAAGFFVRGALTLGPAHLEHNLLYGPALVEAYGLERKVAVNPRIVLSSDAVEALSAGMADEGQKEGGYFRVAQDGSVFIDYLDILLDDPEDPIPSLETHRDMVRAKLGETIRRARQIAARRRRGPVGAAWPNEGTRAPAGEEGRRLRHGHLYVRPRPQARPRRGRPGGAVAGSTGHQVAVSRRKPSAARHLHGAISSRPGR
jgi:hypothetical protein